MRDKIFLNKIHYTVGILLFLFISMISGCYIDAAEQGDFVFNAYSDGAWITKYTGNESTVIIPDTIIYKDKEYKVTKIYGQAFANRDDIETVIIPTSLTMINESAFYNCTSLSTVYYRGTAEEWDNLIILPYRNESLLNAEVKLEYEINADKLQYEIKEDKVVITGCDKSITKISIPERINGFNVTEISENAFSYCTELTSVKLSDGILKIGDFAFSGCIKLESIEWPDSIVDIGKMCFNNCGLTSITVPKGVNEIDDYAFYGCTNLTEIVLHDEINRIGNFAFYDCRQLRKIDLPDSVKYIGDNAFQNCSSLSTFTVPSGVEELGAAMFSGCRKLAEINVAEGNRKYIDRDGVLFSGDMYKLICFPPDKKDAIYKIPEEARKIGESAFYSCENLKKIILPENASYMEDYVFIDCKGLENIVIPKSLLFVGNDLFYGCNNLKNIYYSGTEKEWELLMDKNMGELKSVNIYCNQPYNKAGIGDVNGDNSVNATDALYVLKYAAAISHLDELALSEADVNKDELINATDALIILKYSANLINSFD